MNCHSIIKPTSPLLEPVRKSFETGEPVPWHAKHLGVHLLFAASVAPDAEPRVTELDGTTDAVAWTPVARPSLITVCDMARRYQNSE